MSTLNGPNEEAPVFPPTPARSGTPDWDSYILASVAYKVSTGRARAITAVNRELVATDSAVGKKLPGREPSEGWSAGMVLRLTADLKDRFLDARGSHPATSAT